MALVTLEALMKKALAEHYGVGMFNVVNLEFAEAIIQAAEELGAPVILGLPERFFAFVEMEDLSHLCVGMARRAKAPVAVHLDHGKSFETVMKAIRCGFSSVMFDGSALPYEENIRQTAEIVRAAHAVGVSVEGELGYIGRAHTDAAAVEYDASLFTRPEAAEDFVNRTGVDALAIAIGTIHGVYRSAPRLDFQRLAAIRQSVPVGLVLHGGSGLADSDFQRAVSLGINKINIFTELSLCAMNHVKEALPTAESWLEVAGSLRAALKEVVRNRIVIFGGVGEA